MSDASSPVPRPAVTARPGTGPAGDISITSSSPAATPELRPRAANGRFVRAGGSDDAVLVIGSIQRCSPAHASCPSDTCDMSTNSTPSSCAARRPYVLSAVWSSRIIGTSPAASRISG